MKSLHGIGYPMPSASIHKTLRQFRVDKKMSLVVMAKALGVNKEYLALVEQGVKPVKLALLEKIFRSFGINLLEVDFQSQIN